VVRETVDVYITFVDGESRSIDPEADSVSLKVTASNGAVAHLLQAGSVTRPTGNTPSGLSFRNVAAVTAEVPPPLTDREQWLLVSTLARNFNGVLAVDRLRGVLATFDFRARADVTARQRLENLLGAIERLEARPFDMFIDGRPTRSRRIVLGVREERIGGEGELHLLGSVMNAFLAVFAAVNTHHVFRIEGISSNVGYEWPARPGEPRPS
jgi:type VI secretion system protein ImpG